VEGGDECKIYSNMQDKLICLLMFRVDVIERVTYKPCGLYFGHSRVMYEV